jgi:uncharacterized MAPEG superfamily protein
MPPELTALALAGLLQMGQILLMAVPANRDLGPDWTAGPRDTPPSRPLSPLAGRLQRAVANHFEGLALFTLAVIVVTLSGKGSTFTAACAWAYLGARILYVPAYALGLSPWRTIVWAAGFFATAAMLLAALLG